MRKITITPLLILLLLQVCGQSPQEIIRLVKNAQEQVQHASYTLVRKDTLVTGHSRSISGRVKLSRIASDSLFGCRFWAMKDGVNRESIYDGKTGFTVDHERKQFNMETDPGMLSHFTDNHGGQVFLQDLVRIDTSGTRRMELREDATFYYLLLSLEDIKQYDVINRTKTLVIDKKLMLPLGMIHRQETLGKIQCLDYRITSIQVNNPSLVYDFSAKRYPDEYTSETRKVNKQLFALKGKKMPGFSTTGFDGRNFSSEQMKGKLVLLDFWEVWCGPCIESMPKVQQLYEKYKSKGLEVYGIVHEKEYLETAKQLIGKKKISFPMLLGTETSSKDFSIIAVPTYILINKAGDVVMISEGFSPAIEEEIQKHL